MSAPHMFRAWDGEQMFTFDNCAFTLSYNDISGWNVAPNQWNYHGKWTTGESAENAKSFVLMQYTGLRDKYGVKIYEGDVVRTGLKEPDSDAFYVYWRDELAGWYISDNHGWIEFLPGSLGNRHYLEVIGNIHEGPEFIV